MNTMEWHKAESERPDNDRVVVVKRKAYTRFDHDRFAVCRSGRTLYTLPFFPCGKRDNIPWDLVDSWSYIDWER